MELAYDRRGSGSPLVLLHGIGHHRQGWLPVIEVLAERHDVIAVDFPGFGESPPLPASLPYNAETLGAAVEEFWSLLGVKDPHVAGSSFGGYVALDLASRGAVSTAVALSPAGFWSRTEHFYARMVLRLLRASAGVTRGAGAAAIASSKAGKTMVMGLLTARPSQVPADEVVAAAEALRGCVGFDGTLQSCVWMAPPPPPKVPITIAWGERDRLLPRRQAVRAARWAQERVVLMSGCGHLPMSDDPDLVARVILDSSRD